MKTLSVLIIKTLGVLIIKMLDIVKTSIAGIEFVKTPYGWYQKYHVVLKC